MLSKLVKISIEFPEKLEKIQFKAQKTSDMAKQIKKEYVGLAQLLYFKDY